MRADGILFDKDGTLFDFDATWVAWIEALVARWGGGDPARRAALAAAVGFDPDRRAFDPASIVIAGTPDEAAAVIAPVLGMALPEIAATLNAEAARAPMAEAVPLGPLLTGLRARGLRLGVATNDAEAPARAHLSAAGVVDLFDYIAGSDSGHGAKPGPGMCLGFAAATGLDPARLVMVGDSTHDLHAGRAAGMQVVYDAGAPREKMDEMMKLTDVLIASERFAAEMGSGALADSLKRLHAKGPRTVVITIGEEGSVGMEKDETYIVPATAVDAVDTTGAGDVYHGAFIYGMLQGWGLRERMRFANTAAALKCRSLGGRAGIPTLQEVHEALSW